MGASVKLALLWMSVQSLSKRENMIQSEYVQCVLKYCTKKHNKARLYRDSFTFFAEYGEDDYYCVTNQILTVDVLL